MLLAVLSAGGLLRAETPPLLQQAVEHWVSGRGDLAFTQQTRVLNDDGSLKTDRLERYDPSLPDSQRWRLIEVEGRPPTARERASLETKKNAKPRKKTAKPPGEYLDLEHARIASETPQATRFEVSFRPEVARLIAVEKIALFITVDKKSQRVTRIAATLREPIRVLLGIAKVNDIDLDLTLESPSDSEHPQSGDEIQAEGTAMVKMSRFGDPTEFRWTDFKRVTTYGITPLSANNP